VRIDRIEEVHTLPHRELSLRLTSGEHVISGRRHATAVRKAWASDVSTRRHVPAGVDAAEGDAPHDGAPPY
jgi:hypothetical protein